MDLGKELERSKHTESTYRYTECCVCALCNKLYLLHFIIKLSVFYSNQTHYICMEVEIKVQIYIRLLLKQKERVSLRFGSIIRQSPVLHYILLSI